MKITLLCTDPKHPVIQHLEPWAQSQHGVHEVELVHSKTQLSGGALLFLVSCSEIIAACDRAKYAATLVLHASDLPQGRGWSPHIWDLLQGKEFITLCLLEAEDQVDTGKIWKKLRIDVPKHALWDEINQRLFAAEVALIDEAVKTFDRVVPVDQHEPERATYYPKRKPEDSRIDVNKTIAEQFDLIRVCDPTRFPAYFDHLGHRYVLKVEKLT